MHACHPHRLAKFFGSIYCFSITSDLILGITRQSDSLKASKGLICLGSRFKFTFPCTIQNHE